MRPYGSIGLWLLVSTAVAQESREPDWRYRSSGGMGFVVAGHGDFNGDGYMDIVAGAPSFRNSGNPQEGRIIAFHGGPSGLSSSPDWVTESFSSGLGAAVGVLGDIDGDGYDDLAAGDRDGFTWIFRGSPTGLTSDPIDIGMTNYRAYLGGVGDLNGDGYGDVLLGTRGDYHGLAFQLIHGSPTGLEAEPSWHYSLAGIPSPLISTRAAIGDFDGDSLLDVVCGNCERAIVYAWYHINDRTEPGASYNRNWSFSYGDPLARAALVVAGDINGDGYSDLAVGPGHCGCCVESLDGFVEVFHGSAQGLATASAVRLYSPIVSTLGTGFAQSFATIDMNADGFDDIVVGAYDVDSSTGRVYCYSGSPNGVTAPYTWKASGAVRGDYLGYALANAGDVNGDGLDDLLVGGAYGYQLLGYSGGLLDIYYGSADPVPCPADINGDRKVSLGDLGIVLSAYGCSIAPCAGDVTGDQIVDLNDVSLVLSAFGQNCP